MSKIALSPPLYRYDYASVCMDFKCSLQQQADWLDMHPAEKWSLYDFLIEKLFIEKRDSIVRIYVHTYTYAML